MFVCVCSLQDNSVVLKSSAVAYVSLSSPVRGTETLRATASPTLLQLTSDIQRVSITAAASSPSTTAGPTMIADITATHRRCTVTLT